jgi:selenide, water dikinase
LTESVKLTAMAKAAGCAAKLSPSLLDAVLRNLPAQVDSNVLVGFSTNDDAGIYKLREDLAIVQTVDFFTPIVDDPFTFGQIAAANSLSDIYAMGGKPISSLSLVGFPDKGEPAILEQIVRGGLDKMREAQCTIIGGHSIRNEDILFGYAVTGIINPKKIWKNVGAQTNDVILFTKPLGTGVISTALKKNSATQVAVDAAISAMSRLNRVAADCLHELSETLNPDPIHAVTDVTGFGLLGHSREMALGDPQNGIARVNIEINHKSLPLLPGALQAAKDGMLSQGLKNNREFVGDCVSFADNVPEEFRALLFDPQTSGGLLVALAPDAVENALEIFRRHQVPAQQIGRVLPKVDSLLTVV